MTARVRRRLSSILHQHLYVAASAVLVAGLWVAFFYTTSRFPSTVITLSIYFVVQTGVLARVTSRRYTRLSDLYGPSVVTVALLVLLFSTAYYQISLASPSNFTRQLSHLDAVLFAVDTFTTAGTGDVQSAGDAARLGLIVQDVVDLLFVVGALGFTATRILDRKERDSYDPPRSPPSPTTWG